MHLARFGTGIASKVLDSVAYQSGDQRAAEEVVIMEAHEKKNWKEQIGTDGYDGNRKCCHILFFKIHGIYISFSGNMSRGD